MTINNSTTKKNLNKFITLALKKGKEEGLNNGQLDNLYKNAISVFFFNDLEKETKLTKQVINYFWCVLNPLYY